jgi:hypothetical protein
MDKELDVEEEPKEVETKEEAPETKTHTIRITKTRLKIYVGAFILLVVAFFLLQGPGCTNDMKFCKASKLHTLNCSHMYNATFGFPTRPNDPDFYFCSPYDYEPKHLFYQQDDVNATPTNYIIKSSDELVIFKDLCPFQRNISEYQMYVGNWSILWKKCDQLGVTYLYGEEDGYKRFCCLAPYEMVAMTDTGAVRKNNILIYNESKLLKKNGGLIE